MFIEQVIIKQFRCISALKLSFDRSIIVIEGKNGSGKTSLLEALHFAAYLKSFRTHTPKEIISFGADSFFIRLQGVSFDNSWDIQVGSSGSKKLVKINQQAVSTFKELSQTYRVVSITEEDLELVKGSPEARRAFMDGALAIADPEYAKELKIYRRIVDQRNAVLASGQSAETLAVWTDSLMKSSKALQEKRSIFLQNLTEHIKQLFALHFEQDVEVSISYEPKVYRPELEPAERAYQRTLWGAHLDDFKIIYQDKASRHYASRGQQKLLVVLIKVAQILMGRQSSIILVDDFMTDFDQNTLARLIKLLSSLESQLFITTPTANPVLYQLIESLAPQYIFL